MLLVPSECGLKPRRSLDLPKLHNGMFPWWLRLTRWFNFFFTILLFRSVMRF